MTERLLAQLRRPERPGCGASAEAMEAARRSYINVDSLAEGAGAATGGSGSSSDICSALPPSVDYRPLGYDCPLAARKFLEGTEREALAAAAPCDSSLQLLNDGTCGLTALGSRLLRAWRFGRPLLVVVSGLLAFSLTFSLAVLVLLGNSAARMREGVGLA